MMSDDMEVKTFKGPWEQEMASTTEYCQVNEKWRGLAVLLEASETKLPPAGHPYQIVRVDGTRSALAVALIDT